jgi:hypothetical protein
MDINLVTGKMVSGCRIGRQEAMTAIFSRLSSFYFIQLDDFTARRRAPRLLWLVHVRLKAGTEDKKSAGNSSPLEIRGACAKWNSSRGGGSNY